jgi:predicted nucleic acid-binding protein
VIVVADTGPLLALAKVGTLDLLRELYQQVITGPAIYTEAVTAGLAMNAAAPSVLNETYQRGELIVRQPALTPLPHPDRLHAGEAESIRLAIDLQAEWLLIDDLDARQIAQQNFAVAGVSTGIKGTLGVIVTAVNAQVINPAQAIDWVKVLRDRPDIWLASSLCEQVINTLQRLASNR